MLVASTIINPELDQPLKPVDAQFFLTALILVVGFYAFYSAMVDSVYGVTLWRMSDGLDASLYVGPENKTNMVATGFDIFTSELMVMKTRSLACRMLNFTA